MSCMFGSAPTWTSPSSDPNDQQFGDIVEPTTLEEAGAYDTVIVGEPYDGAVLGRKGACEGPPAIRSALAGTKTHHLTTGPVASVGDLGDLELPASDLNVESVQNRVRDAMREVHDAATLPVCLGGDNSLSFANAAPLLGATLGVISLDAHLDCRELRPEEGPTSGTPYRQLYEAGLDELAVVGARHFETSTRYAEYVEGHGGTIVTAAEVGRNLDAAVDRTLEAVSAVDRIYLSVDMDVLDGPEGPGVSAPTPGGLSARELFALVSRFAADDRIAGFEVVECAPSLDIGDRTSRAAARTIAHFLAGRQADQSATDTGQSPDDTGQPATDTGQPDGAAGSDTGHLDPSQ